MKVTCTLKTTDLNFKDQKEIEFRSVYSREKNIVKLIVGLEEFELDANEVIKAVQNCINY